MCVCVCLSCSYSKKEAESHCLFGCNVFVSSHIRETGSNFRICLLCYVFSVFCSLVTDLTKAAACRWTMYGTSEWSAVQSKMTYDLNNKLFHLSVCMCACVYVCVYGWRLSHGKMTLCHANVKPRSHTHITSNAQSKSSLLLLILLFSCFSFQYLLLNYKPVSSTSLRMYTFPSISSRLVTRPWNIYENVETIHFAFVYHKMDHLNWLCRCIIFLMATWIWLGLPQNRKQTKKKHETTTKKDALRSSSHEVRLMRHTSGE